MDTTKIHFYFFVSLVLIENLVISINLKLSKNGVNVAITEINEVLLMLQRTSTIYNEVIIIHAKKVI